jgi:hypothetical protein
LDLKQIISKDAATGFEPSQKAIGRVFEVIIYHIV